MNLKKTFYIILNCTIVLFTLFILICCFPDLGLNKYNYLPVFSKYNMTLEKNEVLLKNIKEFENIKKEYDNTSKELENFKLKYDDIYKEYLSLKQENEILNNMKNEQSMVGLILNNHYIDIVGDFDKSIDSKLQSEMLENAVIFTDSLFTCNFDVLKNLCSDKLFAEITQVKYVNDKSKLSDSQRVFSKLNNKKLYKYSSITPVIKNDDNYVVILRFFSNTDEGKEIQLNIYFSVETIKVTNVVESP